MIIQIDIIIDIVVVVVVMIIILNNFVDLIILNLAHLNKF